MGTFNTQLTVITKPTSEPVTLTEMKRALIVETSDDDSRISGYIKTARQFAEAYCNINIMPTVVERSFDAWPSTVINLGVWPLQSIDSVKYDDTSSPVTEQTLVVDTDYYADIVTEGGRVGALTGWPSTAVKFKPIRIRMTAGYSNRANVPEQIKDGIKAYVQYLYEVCPDLEQVAKNILWSERRLS